jgi:hypothetical protein
MSKAILDRNIRPAVLGVDDIGETQNIGMDVDSKSLNVNSRVWDSDLMRWVRMTQPTITAPEVITFYDTRIEYDNGNVKYLGQHEINGADVSDEEWCIMFISYENGNVVRIQTAIGSWADRETLF